MFLVVEEVIRHYCFSLKPISMPCSHTRNFRTWTSLFASVSTKNIRYWSHVFAATTDGTHQKNFVSPSKNTVDKKKEKKTKRKAISKVLRYTHME